MQGLQRVCRMGTPRHTQCTATTYSPKHHLHYTVWVHALSRVHIPLAQAKPTVAQSATVIALPATEAWHMVQMPALAQQYGCKLIIVCVSSVASSSVHMSSAANHWHRVVWCM